MTVEELREALAAFSPTAMVEFEKSSFDDWILFELLDVTYLYGRVVLRLKEDDSRAD